MYGAEDSEEETTQDTTGRSKDSGKQSLRKPSSTKPEQPSTSKQIVVSQTQPTNSKLQVEPAKTTQPPSFEVPKPTKEISQVPRTVRVEPEPVKNPALSTQNFEVEGENFRAIENFLAEQPGDLDVQTGEIVKILAVRPDGWWQAKLSDGSTGFVPKNVLEHFPEIQQYEPRIEAPPPRQPIVQSDREMVKEEASLAAPPPVQQPMVQRGPIPVILTEQKVQSPYRPEIMHVRKSDHFSLTCHLTPRLSESNLNFHDIYWSYNKREQAYRIRKRKVRVCKLVKTISIEKIQKSGNEGEENFRLDTCLFDRRSSTGRQIVSNIHSVSLKTEVGGLSNFFSKLTASSEHGKNFLVRSNYAQKEVVLRFELFQSNGTSLGTIEKTLLDENGKLTLSNKTFTETTTIGNGQRAGSGNYRLKFQITDVSSDYADALPDILICDESFIQVFAMYRQLVAEALAERENISKTTWICDPIIATFPRVAADADLMSLFHFELAKKKTLHKNDLKEFRYVYERYVLPICDGAVLPQTPESKHQYLEKFRSQIEADKDDPVAFLSSQKFRPLTMKEYAFDLCCEHAID